MARRMLDDQTVTMSEVAQGMRVSRATLYRALQRDDKEKEMAEYQKETKRLLHQKGVKPEE